MAGSAAPPSPPAPCCQSCGCLKDGSQFTELLCSPAHPGKDLSSLIPINQPRFSLLTPGRDHVRVGKLRHRAAARCQQRLKGLIPFCITKCSCSDSCHNYPRSTGQSFIPSRDLSCERQERSKFNLVYKSHPKMLQKQSEALAEPLAVLLRPWESQRLDLSKASWRSWGLQPLSIAPAQGREGREPGGAAVSSSAQVMDGSKPDLLPCWGRSSDCSRVKWGHEMRPGLQVPVFISGC